MLIRLKKTRDGVVLTCFRDSAAPAVQRTGHGGFFAMHDLIHYAVENTLGMEHAFFGLMAEGWDFESFGDHTDERYKQMPAEAVVAEHVVAVLSRRYMDRAWSDEELLSAWSEEVNAEIALVLGRADLPARPIESSDLLTICRRFDRLLDFWAAVPVGEHLELSFPGDAEDGTVPRRVD